MENEEAAQRGLDLFQKWNPPAGLTFHEFLARVDGRGGYALIETDNPRLLSEGPSKFSPYFRFTTVPVMDIQEATEIGREAIDFRQSIR